ncbi:MAG: hypothetical protein E2604_10600 [Flavobacterium sp.]|nr:hypothetical protein [Flavobacterium sp.]
MMKKIIAIFSVLFFLNGCCIRKQDKSIKIEKGLFLYEVNVPLRYYTFEDAIETPEHLLRLPKDNDHLLDSYKEGVYFFAKNGQKKDSLIRKYENMKMYDLKSINKLIDSLSSYTRDYYLGKQENYYWIGNMAFIKFYAEFYVQDVGQIEEMIPKLENYKCCYSNTIEKVKGRVIVKVKKIKLKKLMKVLKLNSGSIDMLVSSNNEYVFLEVNPIGQFGQVSKPCNYYLEKQIAKELNKISKYGTLTN